MAAGLTAPAAAGLVTARVEDLSHDGRGVAHVEGKTVFIDGALSGELARFRIHKRRRDFDEAELCEVLEPSPDRVQPRCAVFGICGGCRLQHLRATAQCRAKERELLANLARIGRVEPENVLPALTATVWGYRRRARMGVRFVPGKGRVLVGFRERAKRYLCDMTACEVLHPSVGRRLAVLSEVLGRLSIRSEIPQIEVAVGDHATVLALRTLAPPNASDLEHLKEFQRETGLTLLLQPGGLDSMYPLVPPVPELYYDLPDYDVRIFFRPGDFIQVNAELNRAMVVHALGLLDPQPGETVLDLFAGLGNFSLPLARNGARVMAVEGDRGLIERARHNALHNRLDDVKFALADLFDLSGQHDWLRRRYERVLLDPPRAGAEALIEHMDTLAPERIVYVSCHPGTLARDAGRLVAGKGYRLKSVGIMDMFPHTAHVESIAVFER